MVENDDFTPFIERLADELDEVREDVDAKQHLIEPNAEELRNGWTAETLTAYVAQRTAGAELKNDPHSLHRKQARRPTRQTGYNPLRWRG